MAEGGYGAKNQGRLQGMVSAVSIDGRRNAKSNAFLGTHDARGAAICLVGVVLGVELEEQEAVSRIWSGCKHSHPEPVKAFNPKLPDDGFNVVVRINQAESNGTTRCPKSWRQRNASYDSVGRGIPMIPLDGAMYKAKHWPKPSPML